MIQVSLSDGILELKLDRPVKMNAMTSAMYLQLAQQILEAQKSPDVRVILISAEGDHFCAGNDMGDFLSIAQSGGDDPDPSSFAPVHLLHALVDNEIPIVAAVRGNAVGIGFTLLLHCDLVVCAEDAHLQTPFVDLALVPEAGSSQILPQRLGRVLAAELLLLGAPISGRRAYEVGLCNRVVEASQVDGIANELAAGLARKPAQALRESRRMLNPDSAAMHRCIDSELEIFFKRLRSAEAAQLLQRFFQRKG